MTRFIRFLQLIIAIVVGAFIGYDLILHGISIFEQKYVMMASTLFILLEISLFVIYKLIEDD